MHVPFHKPDITQYEIAAVNKALSNGWLTMGQQTFAFEQHMQQFTGALYCRALNSCTAALHLVFQCIGIGEGDEVIVPDITFTATGGVVTHCKARPVIVDVSRETHLIDVSEVEKRISPATKAIVPVHFSGQPADMDELLALGKEKKIYIVEDAAHSLPSYYKGNMIGSFGDAACYSFYATKTLTTGEGGMVATGNKDWAEQIELLRLHGIDRDAWNRYDKEGSWQYDVIEPGYKYNTTDINAALGIEQLKRVEQFNKNRKSIADRYNNAFSGVKGLITYIIKKDRKTCWHLYPLKLDLDAVSISRDRFIDELRTRGISTSVHFIPLHRFTYYKNSFCSERKYNNSDWIFERTFSLPIYPSMTDSEVNYVIENVLDIVKKHAR